MGFLDHSTNNIIVDAVLTDYGRQKLASQGGAATKLVAYYAFADEEVDYSMITKYGVIVGKEKIEKNTPIFEATTNAAYSSNSLLRSVSNPSSAQAVTTVNLTNSTLSSASNANSSSNLTIVTTDPQNQLESITYLITYDSRFIKISGNGDLANSTGTTKTFKIQSSNNQSISVDVSLVQSGASIMKEVYGSLADVTTIKVLNASTDETTFTELSLNYTSS